MNGQIKKQNNTIKAYHYAFVNFKHNNWAQFLLMTKFAYNNAKNTCTKYTLFELNYEYYPWVFYKEDLNSQSMLKTAKKLSFKF